MKGSVYSMYCENCGNQINDDSKFCNFCGAKQFGENHSNPSSHRNVVFDGVQHKCVHCGEILNSFVTYCPNCGYELRDLKADEGIKKLSISLKSSNSLDEKIEIIRTFSVPNSRETLIEFLAMCKSNIINCDKNGDGNIDNSERALLNAWKAKFDQCYEKAKLVLKDEDLKKFEETYDEIKESVSKTDAEVIRNKNLNFFKQNKKMVIAISITSGITVLMFFAFFFRTYFLSAFITLVMLALFILSLLLGGQVIKNKFKYTYLVTYIIGLVLFFPLIFAVSSEQHKSYYDIWPEIVNKEQVPEVHYNGIIKDDKKDYIRVSYLLSKEELKELINTYIEFGYSIESEQNGNDYKAYNSKGYLAIIDESYSDTTVEIKAPAVMNAINWPENSLTAKIPNPNKTYGIIDRNSDSSVEIHYKGFSYDEYNQYVDDCMGMGFTKDYSRQDKTFRGDKTEWFTTYSLHVDYESNGVVRIYIYK